MSKRRRDRLYLRPGRGWYADFRDVGGGREAMKPPGQRHATQDRDEAAGLMTARLKQLKDGSARPDDPLLFDYAKRHLEIKAGNWRPSTIERDERSLWKLVEFLGRDVRLSEITVGRLNDYLTWRRRQRGHNGQIAPQTVLHELHALSSLFRCAIGEGLADANPVSLMPGKPKVDRDEAEWLEIDEAARLLKAVHEMDDSPARRAFPHMYPLIATYLYTGGRKLEVFGLEHGDVDPKHGVIRIRPNRWRKLKRRHHRRTVPLWPDLNRILAQYVERTERTAGLLFRSRTDGLLTDIRGSLQTALERARIEKPVTLHTLRHTYGATRMQTLDHGAPVSPYTLMRELGHRDLKLIEDTYGHLQSRRERTDVVRYRETRVVPLPAQTAS